MGDPRKVAAFYKQGGVYKMLSEIDPGTQDLLDSPTPEWLNREYPYVAPPGEDYTLKELDYLVSLIPLREEWASFIRAADEDMKGLFVTLCSELGVPCDEQALSELAAETFILITKLKWLYNRPRPYQVAAKHLRLSGQGGVFRENAFSVLDSKTAHTPAYPSGHTIQANLFAARLSEAAPQHRKAFMDLAEKVSFSRAVAGYHWPSDLVFGKDIFRHIVMPLMPSAVRVAKTFTVNKGDAVWYGKYKNQRGLVKNFGMSDKGDPTVTVEQLPSPSARKPKKKSPKTLNLFKIRPRKKDEHDEGAKEAASKALSKKEVPKADGSGTMTVYEYGPRQVAQRHKEKAVRVEALRKKMDDLRRKARGDLTAKDPETRLTALAVCLMDETYERVGNEKSAKDGHHGVTNWTADHITLSDKAATIKYTGKSGVKHEKKVTNARVLSALRKALKGKGNGDKVLCDGDECSILAKDVNAYLKPYGITAKDIRGLHANEEMKHHLKAQRKSGPSDLPHSRKEKDEVLKAEFQAALDLAAAAVGHEASTLRSQYLVPSMEASYVHDGTVIDKLDKKASSLEGFLDGFFRRHPKLSKYRRLIRFRDREQGSSSGHGEARQHGDEVWVFPKFWTHQRGVQDFVLAHEIGHWVKSNNALGSAFMDAARSVGVDPWDTLNLPFGQFNMDEAFADSFASYYTDGDVKRRYPEWSQLVEAVILGGRRVRTATLSDSEREDREAERLVRQSPKKKPPRKDKERGRIKDTDPDTDPDETQDQKDRSNNYKDAAARLALRFVVAGAAKSKRRAPGKKPSAREVARRKQQSARDKANARPKRKAPPKLKEAPAPSGERQERNVGDTWEVDGKWSAKGKDGIQSGFASDEAAKAWLKGGPKPGADDAPASGTETPHTHPKSRKKREMVRDLSESFGDGAASVLRLPETLVRAVVQEIGEPAAAIVDAVTGDTASLDERAAFAQALLKRIPSGTPPTDKQISAAEALLKKHGEAGETLEGLEDELADLQEGAPTADDALSSVLALKKKVEDAIEAVEAKAQEVEDATDDKAREKAQKALDSLKEAVGKLPSLKDLAPRIAQAEVVDAHEKEVKALSGRVKEFQQAVKTTEAQEAWEGAPSPAEIAQALVATRAAEVRKDPLLLDLKKPLTNRPKEPLNLEGDAQKEFMSQMGDLTVSTMSDYREMSSDEREAHKKGLQAHLKELDHEGATDTEQYHATLAQLRGLQTASALEDGDKAEGVSPALQTFLQAAQLQGADVLRKFVKLNVTGAAEGGASAQQQFRDLLHDTEPKDLKKMVAEDHPAQVALTALTGGGYEGKKKDIWMKHMDSESMEMLQELAEDLIMDEIMFTDMDLVRKGKNVGQIKSKPSKSKVERHSRGNKKIKSVLGLLRKQWEKTSQEAAALLDTTSSGYFGKPKPRSTTKSAASDPLQEYDFASWGVSLSPQNGNPPR